MLLVVRDNGTLLCWVVSMQRRNLSGVIKELWIEKVYVRNVSLIQRSEI